MGVSIDPQFSFNMRVAVGGALVPRPPCRRWNTSTPGAAAALCVRVSPRSEDLSALLAAVPQCPRLEKLHVTTSCSQFLAILAFRDLTMWRAEHRPRMEIHIHSCTSDPLWTASFGPDDVDEQQD